MTQVDPSAVAAIIVEPVPGEGGFIPASFEYMRRARQLRDKYGILLIADECSRASAAPGAGLPSNTRRRAGLGDILAKSIAATACRWAQSPDAEILDAPHLGGIGSTSAATR